MSNYVNSESDTTQNWTMTAIIKRLNDQTKLIEQMNSTLRDLQGQTDLRQEPAVKERLSHLETNLEFALLTTKTIADNLLGLREQFAQIQSSSQQSSLQGEVALKGGVARLPSSRSVLSSAMYDILSILSQQEQKSSKEISLIIHRSREHTTRLMKNLSQIGLVQSVSASQPARFVLTNAGSELIRSLVKNVSP